VEYDHVNNLRFVGRYGGYKDDDTGLTYFWHRWYDERDGRWVSRDMIGTDEMNLYNYVRNRPQFYIDWYGLCPGGEPIPIPVPRPGMPSNWWEETWQKIDTWKKWIPWHGNYCGPAWSSGKWKTESQETTFTGSIKDGVDNCCRNHDICAWKVRTQQGCDTMSDCDKKLLDCFKENFLNDPIYISLGIIGFTVKRAVGK